MLVVDLIVSYSRKSLGFLDQIFPKKTFKLTFLVKKSTIQNVVDFSLTLIGSCYRLLKNLCKNLEL